MYILYKYFNIRVHLIYFILKYELRFIKYLGNKY